MIAVSYRRMVGTGKVNLYKEDIFIARASI